MTDLRKLRKVQRLIQEAADDLGQVDGRRRVLVMSPLCLAETQINRWVTEEQKRRPVHSRREKAKDGQGE